MLWKNVAEFRLAELQEEDRSRSGKIVLTGGDGGPGKYRTCGDLRRDAYVAHANPEGRLFIDGEEFSPEDGAFVLACFPAAVKARYPNAVVLGDWHGTTLFHGACYEEKWWLFEYWPGKMQVSSEALGIVG